MAKTPHVTKVTISQAVRDVFIASINKGQFPLALLGAIILFYFWLIPPDALAEQGHQVVDDLRAGYLVGYLLGIGAIGGWYLHAKSLRRSHYEELHRMAEEKTELQKKQLPGKVKSSKS
ncbi:MAG: hypothetical protein IT173_09075 [Acidobacteria bacterium]|nr:hypothetical protein [Acidobacteriota bacterium]